MHMLSGENAKQAYNSNTNKKTILSVDAWIKLSCCDNPFFFCFNDTINPSFCYHCPHIYIYIAFQPSSGSFVAFQTGFSGEEKL